MCRVDIAVVAPRLMAELNLSQLAMGKVFSAFLLGYTLFQVPSGWPGVHAAPVRRLGARLGGDHLRARRSGQGLVRPFHRRRAGGAQVFAGHLARQIVPPHRSTGQGPIRDGMGS